MLENEVKTQKFVLKLFTEIMIKGSSTRRQMVSQLYNNLLNILRRVSKDIDVKKFSDKLEVLTPVDFVDSVRQILLDTPGIDFVLEATQFNQMNTLDDIKVAVNNVMGKEIVGKSFVVKCKRTGTHPFTSMDIERAVGGYMLANNESRGVSLKSFDIKINIELVHHQLYIVTKKHDGLSGFPMGTQGSILSLMSGGFDSTVASYLMMRRGIKTNFVFFNLGGVAHEIGVKQVAYYLWQKFGSSHRITLTSVPFEEVVTEIFKSTHETYMGVTLKRLMLMASEKIANDMKIEAIVTGEAIGQVSSQTLRNLALIDQATSKLVLRPLCSMNKPEIMQTAQDIGTKHFAEAMPEYCGVISKNPVTHGSYERMEKEAARFDYSVLEDAIKNAKVVNVDEIDKDIQEIGQLEVVDTVNENCVVVDIRQSEDCIKADCETRKIPFYRLKSEIKNLPEGKDILLYCEKGILSQLHGQFLRDSENYKNIKVYRP